jgi:hypothetical protein
MYEKHKSSSSLILPNIKILDGVLFDSKLVIC